MLLENTLDVLEHYGIRPRKGYGQNFLVDQEVLDDIVNSADLKKNDKVLEIGPGLGVLTERLAADAAKILAIEADPLMRKILVPKFKKILNVEIMAADALQLSSGDISEKLGDDYKIVANLPYNITGKFLRKFLTMSPLPKSLVLMLQKEVAERIVARSGKMSLLAVAVQIYGEPKIVRVVASESFYPQPEVKSAIIKIVRRPEDFFVKQGVDAKKFWQIVRIGFSSRRKQLQNNLSAGLKIEKDKIIKVLNKAKIAEKARAQELFLNDWIRLVKMF
ncbi:MAG: 16S rRNA (adenine(1518)-N(6)/adenine(1519)-N(6))-dimethyltransferase RsmA [Patescibacteria group bacterium]|jgi:16S rRNA (adenine1518-N6/adenine1519-N6)-dimethyltransferase